MLSSNIKISELEISDHEVESVKKIDKLIENGNSKPLKMVDVRNEVAGMVYADAIKLMERKKGKEKRETFKEEYEDIYENPDNAKNFVLKSAFGKKWARIYHYDYDASYCANCVYCAINFFSKEYYMVHMDKNSYLYLICDNDGMKYRGDTMNTWSTTLNEFIRQYGNEFFYNLEKSQKGKWIYKKEGAESYKSWEEFLSKPSNYKKPLPEYIMEFMEVVYTIGNFIPVLQNPINFNVRRSAFTKDYWDLTLLAIYEYYMGIRESTSLSRWLLGEERIASWFNQFGNGEDGWNQFVKKNYMGSFVYGSDSEGYGGPRELWDNHFTGKMLPEKEQFEQFFVNAKVRILKRGKLIADALVKEQEKESKTQK